VHQIKAINAFKSTAAAKEKKAFSVFFFHFHFFLLKGRQDVQLERALDVN
jgi:hypothetical protein